MRAQSNPSLKEFVLIEYPGIVKDLGKALRTLGGLEAISNVCFIFINIKTEPGRISRESIV
jgi:hypothetical protein